MDSVNLKAPAKINLYLRVLDKRPDGYHNIDSLMQTISLFDELILERSDKIDLLCPDLENLPIEHNLAYRAAKMVAEMAYFPGVRISLKKNIPPQAGLGGGSADAAFVIRGLIKLYDLYLDKKELVKNSAILGADIPFYLGSGQAHVTGIGEIVKPCALPYHYNIIIVKPPLAVETAKAYEGFDQVKSGKFCLTNDNEFLLFQQIISDQDFIRSANHFSNDLEEVVFSWHHELRQIKRELKQLGAFYAGMSGSGSAVFGLFSPERDIEETANMFDVDRNKVFICKPVLLPPVN